MLFVYLHFYNKRIGGEGLENVPYGKPIYLLFFSKTTIKKPLHLCTKAFLLRGYLQTYQSKFFAGCFLP